MNQSRSLDDFNEFLTDAYRPVLDALAANGLTGHIETGANGHHILVTHATNRPDIGHRDAVEVTHAGRPLPDDPSDVTFWLLTHGNDRILVAAESELAGFIKAFTGILRSD